MINFNVELIYAVLIRSGAEKVIEQVVGGGYGLGGPGKQGHHFLRNRVNQVRIRAPVTQCAGKQVIVLDEYCAGRNVISSIEGSALERIPKLARRIAA